MATIQSPNTVILFIMITPFSFSQVLEKAASLSPPKDLYPPFPVRFLPGEPHCFIIYFS
jgi:hypothetical protein